MPKGASQQFECIDKEYLKPNDFNQCAM